jgi:hypothetical protein
MIDKLRADHQKIRGIVARFCELLFTTEPCDGACLAAIRWELGSAVMQNLAFEERHIYSKLAAAGTEQSRALMADPNYDLGAIFALYTRHVELWPPARAQAEWLAYRSSAENLLEVLLKRMEWEERQIFPLAERGAFTDLPQSLLTQNWARGAFAIKDQLLSGTSGPPAPTF